MEKKINLPQKGAGRRLAQKLEDLGKQSPPKELLEKMKNMEKKKVARPAENIVENSTEADI